MNVTLQADNIRVSKKAKADVEGPSVQGQALFTEYDIDGAKYVHIRLELSGDPKVLTPGKHAVHIHEKAKCDCEGFTCAGGHFDPGPSGNTDPDANHGYHAGDLPSITVDEQGKGVLEAITTRVTLSDGPVSLLDPATSPEGTWLMVPANPDPHTPSETGSGQSGGARCARGPLEAA